MPSKGRTTVTLSIELLNEIDRYIETHPELEYQSKVEFIREAIREKFQRIDELEIKKVEFLIEYGEYKKQKAQLLKDLSEE